LLNSKQEKQKKQTERIEKEIQENRLRDMGDKKTKGVHNKILEL